MFLFLSLIGLWTAIGLLLYGWTAMADQVMAFLKLVGNLLMNFIFVIDFLTALGWLIWAVLEVVFQILGFLCLFL